MTNWDNDFYEVPNKALLICNINGSFIKANLLTISLLGISEIDLKNLNIFTFFEMKNFQARILNDDGFVSFETKINFDKIKKHNFYQTSKSGIAFFKIKINLRENQEYLIELEDVTARYFKNLEFELHKIKEDCQIISENVADLISRYTLSGDYIYVSDICESMLGYSSEELKGRYLYEFIKPEDYEIVKNSHVSILNFPIISTVVYRMCRKDGKYVWVETSSKVIRDEENNRPKEIIAVSRDITERKRIEEELNKTRKDYKSIIDDLTEGVCRFFPNGTITFVNLPHAQIFNKTPEELIGKNIFDLHSEIEDPNALKEFLSLFTPEKDINSFERHLIKDGTNFWFYKTIRGMFDENANVIEFQSVSRDITELKESQIELQKAKEEALATAVAKTEFLTTMSHEIRNPMNAVIGMTDLLMNTELTDEQYKYLETIKISGQSLLNIINDVLDFSKIESGKMIVKKSKFELRKCIENVFDFVSLKTLENNIELFYFIEKDVPDFIVGDEIRIRQILLNLVGNAVKFTEKGSIYVSVSISNEEKENLELIFSVIDTGIGIPSDRIKDLFQNYSQIISPLTKKFEGTGLGLVISKKLVEMMGGKIWVESKKNKGTTFFFTTNVLKIKNNQNLYKDEELEILKNKKILIMDNKDTSIDILCNLCRDWGMIPIPIYSKTQALEYLNKKNCFDIAVLDYNFSMSQYLNLYDFEFKNNKFPVIFIANLDRKELKNLKTNDLSSTFITKPIKHSQLFRVFVNIFSGKINNNIIEKRHNIIIDKELSKKIPLNILVAEDNEVNQYLMLRILEKMGYNADSASNGIDVLETVKQKQYHLIFMDINMPKMNGFEATKEISKICPFDLKPKIIALTASAMHEDEKKCIEFGMDDYLSKPVSIDDIERIIKKWGKQLKIANDIKLEEKNNEVKVFDPSFFKKIVNIDDDDNIEFLVTFIDKFIEQSDLLINEIKEAHKTKDSEQIGRLAHKLKGSSLTIGANVIGNLCNEIASESKNNEFDKLFTLVEKLERDYKDLTKEIIDFKGSLTVKK